MEMCFEDCGLMIGLISYSFDTDGRELYNLFENISFKEYIENKIKKFSIGELPVNMYKPSGYRLFGNDGLAILSLIDDYAFCDQVFSSNYLHLSKTFHENEKLNKGKRWKYNYKTITGVSESKTKDYLRKKAENTFLRPENKSRFPFIGISKLKVDYRLLFGNGITLTRKIKEHLEQVKEKQLHDKLITNEFDFIVVDCFDNDELTVVAFAHDLEDISTFFSGVRNISCEDLDIQIDGVKAHCKHIFSSNYVNLGYDITIDFKKYESDFRNIRLKLIWEPKTGHENSFREYLTVAPLACESVEPALTGGNTLSHYISLKEIHELEEFCLKKETEAHIRKIKITVCWTNQENIFPEVNREIPENPNIISGFIFDYDQLIKIKRLLRACRVSKIVRERLLKIYGLYNDNLKDVLHAGYFFELRGALDDIVKILENWLNSEDVKIGEIDTLLSEIIQSLEDAYYNRFHQKEIQETNLEYNGGIHHHLTSFDYTYKEIINLFCAGKIETPASFVSVSGYEKVTSTRVNLRLNINHISYPELFAVTVWKEAANFTYPFLRNNVKLEKENIASHEYQKKFAVWTKFINKKNSLINVRTILENQDYFVTDDEVYKTASRLLNKETIEYLFIDLQSFHFGFARNYELFYYFYWKYFLQISQHYDRDGKIDKDYFVAYLLRLFIVGFYQCQQGDQTQLTDNKSFFQAQRFKPFDSALSEMWLLCYDKIYECACTIWKELNKYNFQDIAEYEVHAIEYECHYQQMVKQPKDKASIFPLLKARKKVIGKLMKVNLENAKLALEIEGDFNAQPKDKTYLICLLNAYLLVIKELDSLEKKDVKLKSVSRDKNGKIFIPDGDGGDLFRQKISNLPVDPFGGVFIVNSEIRGKYFAYRTSFYRSLWNYVMVKNKNIISGTENNN